MQTYLRLKTIKGVSDNSITEAVRRRGTLEGIFDLAPEELQLLGFETEAIRRIRHCEYDDKFVDGELQEMERFGIRLIRYEDDLYPALLKETVGAPAYLYHLGQQKPLTMPGIAIVGARRSSQASQKFSQKIARDLAEVGFNVVSGFAYGIDIHAHLGSIETGCTTAVMGNGLMKVYPDSHKKYVRDILEKGCMLSEFPLRETPKEHNFPRRNRIVSGMSRGVLVVEAGPKSGSLITARMALEQGRDVFAVPTWPGQFNSATNELIKNGARLVESYLDIVEEFAYLLNPSFPVDKSGGSVHITFDSYLKRKIYDTVNLDPMGRDDLCLKLKADIGELMTAITEMELDGTLFRDTDGKYRPGGEYDG